MANLNQTIDRSLQISRSVATVFERRMRDAAQAYAERVRKAQAANVRGSTPATRINPQQACQEWLQYGIDFAQRSILFWDTLRERGNRQPGSRSHAACRTAPGTPDRAGRRRRR